MIPCTANCRGFTLLEILLALVLVVVVLGLLGMAVDVSLRMADACRNEVEGSQSARIVLKQMADDLRRAIPVTPAPSSIGCLQGNRQELQVDISHMPLLDGMQRAAPRDNAGPPSPPSDVRTVGYWVARPDDAKLPGGGLVRLDHERASFAFSSRQSQTDTLGRDQKVLSRGVEMIEFTYYDGTASYQEWDSIQKGKLPTAVKIAVAIRDPRRDAQRPIVAETVEPRPSTTYAMLVDLPNARATLGQAIAAVSAQSAGASQETKASDSTSQGSDSQSTGIKEIKPIGSGGSSQ
jgi:prepilin-type N-terminal cleavage/methylation domain-containing protein